MIRIILTLVLVHQIVAQPRCSTTGIPAVLPALQTQHILLDLSRHILGPNLTLSMSSSSPLITLRPKFTLAQQTHNLNNILEVTNVNGIVSMLGVSSAGKYYIYYASAHDPHLLHAKEIPLRLRKCTNHALSPDAAWVAITCENESGGKFVVAYSRLNDVDPWQIYETKKYAASFSREIEFLDTNRLAVIIMDPFNSYIEVWDTQYGRIIGIYDRAFLQLEYLNITDVVMTGGSLFILDYVSGIYQLKFVYNTFIILRQLQFTYYSKMAVHIDSIVVSKKGSITEFGGKSVFKYETAGTQPIKQLIISEEYIIVYMSSHAIGYLRGYPTPYFTITIENEMIWGTFVNDTRIIQTVSNENTTEMILQEIQLSRPYLTLPDNVLNRSQIVVEAVSRLDGLEEHCKLNFTVLRTEEMKMEIFDNELSRNGTEHIYMNRPGRAEVDLTAYGMGPNLNYDVQMFAQTVNLTVEVRKKRIVENVSIEGLDKLRAKATYFSNTCGLYRNQCPLAVDTYNLGMMRFYLCAVERDFYGMAHHINCTEKFKEFKSGEYVHYQLEQSSGELEYFYEISVNDGAQNQISVRKFQITELFFRPVISKKHRINGTNKYGQNNITQLEFDEQNKLLYALIPLRKQIQVFQLLFEGDDVQFELIMTINREAVGGRFFMPSRFQLDSDGGLWVKSIDEIIVFDFRQVDRIQKPVILSTIRINLDLVKTYDYDFQIVEQNKASQLFGPNEQDQFSASTKGYEQRNRKYLVLYNEQDTLLMCTVSHLYEIDQKQLQPLPMYGHHVPRDKKDRFIQALGNSQVFVTLFVIGQLKINMIYNLDCLSLVSSYYTSFQTRNAALPAYFYISTENPIVMFFEVAGNSTYAMAVQLTSRPKMLLNLNQMLGQTQSQQLLIKVYNEKVQIRHSVVLGISNSPENLTKGHKYPYPNHKVNALDRYIQTDTVGWVSGNVLKISYACTDCDKPAHDDLPYVQVKGKLWTKADMTVAGAHQFQVITNRGYEVAMMRNNMIYILNSMTNQMMGLHQLTQFTSDIITTFKVNWQHRIVAGVVKSQTGDLSIVTYSITNFKGFILERMALPTSLKYIINMDYKGNVIALLDFSNVYLISVDNLGDSYLVDYINEVEAGGAICWAELLEPIAGNNDQYTLILTLCQSGITYISFKLQENFSVLNIVNKQSLDLKENLNSVNIRMPTDSSFMRTVTTRSQDYNSLNVLILIRSFNSFEWKIELKNKVIITSVKVVRVIHRYGDLGATQDISVDQGGRFMVITYYGLFDNHYQYIHAVYDLMDTFQGIQDEPLQNCYIMETVMSQVNKKPQFGANRSLLVLSDDANHLKRIDVHNKLRVVVHNEDKLETQSLFMIPFSPFSSISIEVRINGIDLVVWQLWEILIIVLLSLIVLAVLGCLLRIFIVRYQQNRKLIPLLVDYAEYEQDLAEEIEERKRKSSHSDSKKGPSLLQQQAEQDEEQGEKPGNINVSERGSVNV